MYTKLYSVYTNRHNTYHSNLLKLYLLLGERTVEQAISHKKMPTFEEHEKFVESRPYKEWYMLYDSNLIKIIGSLYISKNNEIGLFIFKEHHSKGYGSQALQFILDNNRHTIFKANINPQNYKSINFFKKFGFLWQGEKSLPGQYTYERAI